MSYAYRWLGPQCEPRISEAAWASADPTRRQLLGAKVNQTGFYNARDEDAPLKVWLEENDVEL